MRILITAALVMLALVFASSASARGVDIDVPANGTYNWKSDYVFDYPPEPFEVTEYAVDEGNLLNSNALQIGPCAWHWFTRTGDLYLSIPCRDSLEVHRVLAWGTNYTSRTIHIRVRWHLT